MAKKDNGERRGAISDRIRSGDIPKEALNPARAESVEEMPNVENIRHGGGYGLGRGATRARSGE